MLHLRSDLVTGFNENLILPRERKIFKQTIANINKHKESSNYEYILNRRNI